MKIKVRIGDINGSLIKLLLSAILCYKCLIQHYIEISNLFLILGAFLLGAIFIDCGGKMGRFLSGHSRCLQMMMLYCGLTVVFGALNAPSILEHLMMSVTVIEFLFVGMCISYYGKTRGTVDFLVKDYIVIFGILLVLFIAKPVVISTTQGIRYSVSKSMNSNALALYISMFVWAVLYRISQRRIGQIIGFALVGVAFYGVFLTGSRKGFIACVLIVIVWTVFVYLKSRNSIGKFFLILAISLLALYYLKPVFLSSSLWTRLNNFGDEGTRNRLEMYAVGLNYLKMSPLTGLGFNGFKHNYGYYSHSSFVEVFVSSGIPLSILYFSSFAVLFYEILNKKRRLKESGILSDSLLIDFKMKLILLMSIVISFAYIIHVYDLAAYYSLGLIFMWTYTPENIVDEHESL